MPVLYSQYENNFDPFSNNQYLSRMITINKMKSVNQNYIDNQYLKQIQSNAYNMPIDAKTLNDMSLNIQSIYKKNIELMIKLKNKFTTSIGGVPPAPPASILPPAPPSPAPVASPPAPVPVAPPAYVAPSASPYLPFSSYFGFGKKSRGKRGGAVRIIESYNVGTEILTLIDNINNNVKLIKNELMRLIGYRQYLTPTIINEITNLHNEFFSFFNENIIPFRPAHIIPPLSSIINVDYMEIIDKLNELYVDYYNSFNNNLIKKLNNVY